MVAMVSKHPAISLRGPILAKYGQIHLKFGQDITQLSSSSAPVICWGLIDIYV